MKIDELNDEDKKYVFCILSELKRGKKTDQIIGHLDDDRRLNILKAALECSVAGNAEQVP